METQIRKIERIIQPQVTMDGAGVKLRRSIASRDLNYLDPFLLFDHFGSDNPDDYIAGFPMHPHRGIETVTYMLAGAVDHRDSLGHSGSIEVGDVQWMTAGSGIMHEEMPQLRGGRLDGFQLWVNLPAKLKMSPPRYQEFKADEIPEIDCGEGGKVKIIAGEVANVRGPVTEIAADPSYLDVTLAARARFTHPVPRGHAAFAYLFEGDGSFGALEDDDGTAVQGKALAIFGDGDTIDVKAGANGTRFLLISGKPLQEPIACYGPFVMNTEGEIKQALIDLKEGTFVKQPSTS